MLPLTLIRHRCIICRINYRIWFTSVYYLDYIIQLLTSCKNVTRELQNMTSHQYTIFITFYITNVDDVKIDQPSTKQFE